MIKDLTRREQQVARLLLDGGKTNIEIGKALGVQEVTIKLHVRGLCDKLGARNRTQAALMLQAEKLQREES